MELFASTRPAVLADLAGMQFEAQDGAFRARYPGATYEVIDVDGRRAGRLIVARTPEEVRVVDISLVPEVRGRGIGTALLREVVTGADAEGVPVTLSVAFDNPARRLYQRVGFEIVGRGDVYLETRRPPQVKTAS